MEIEQTKKGSREKERNRFCLLCCIIIAQAANSTHRR